MLYYYVFWMIMGFIMHFYFTFGTNLLTGGPAHIALPVSVFQRKGISNGVQMEWNLRERDFWNEHCRGGCTANAKGWLKRGGGSRGPQDRGARPVGGGLHPLGRLGCFLTSTQVLWITFVPKRSLPKVSFRLDSVWYSFSSKHRNRQKNSNTVWASG